MAYTNKVVRSINNQDGSHCVDVFQRADGTFGYEQYRRDPEDARGWFAIGNVSTTSFETADAALSDACNRIIWLTSV